MRTAAFFLAATCLAGAAAAAPASADDPLDPDRAFRPSVRLVAGDPSSGSDRHGIDIEYRIEPGYYLYRNRLKFELSPATVLVGAPELPPGLEMDDPFLGKTAIFRDRVTIHLPFAVSVAKPGRYKLKITAQGCAEDRLCYSPFPQEVLVNIPPGYRVTDSPSLPVPRAPAAPPR